MITATHIPAIIPENTVTITMPTEVAAKLRALLGSCNHRHFDEIVYALDRLPIEKLRLKDIEVIFDKDTINILPSCFYPESI